VNNLSTIQGWRFIFNDKSSDEYGVLLVYGFSSSQSSNQSNDEETVILTEKIKGSDKFRLIGVEYPNPLRFQIAICNEDGSFIDAYKQRQLKKWLCRKDEYHWLKVYQDDLNDVRYHCMITYSNMENVGAMTAGMYFNVQCDSPFAYTSEKIKTYTCTNSVLNFDFYYDSDFEKEDNLYRPTLIITSATNGTIEVKNNTINESLRFTNCTNGEIITVSEDGTPSTTANRVIIDDWNYGDFYLVDGKNSITISGNCTLKIIYYYKIRVGG